MHTVLTSILAAISKHYACVIIGNVGDGNFRPSFYNKKAVLSQKLSRGRNRSRRNQRTPTCGVVDNCPPCS